MAIRQSEIVPIKLPDGSEFLMEISTLGGFKKVAGGLDFDYKNLVKSITGVSSLLVNAVKSAGPDKLSVEFGVEFSAKAGKLLALLCSGEGKANLKITLEWSANKSNSSSNE